MDTIAQIKRKILPVIKEPGVVKAALFGSTARGGAKKGSDVDLLIKFKGRRTLFYLGGLYAGLEGKLGRGPDLATYGSVNKRIKPYIMKDKIDLL